MSGTSKKIIYRLAILLGPWLIRLVGFTLRIQKINPDPVRRLSEAKDPFILCFWHGRMFLTVFLHRNQGVVAMISQHEDGEMIARIAGKLGWRAIRGSSSRGGREALFQMLSHLKNGGAAAMLPDGPTGPRRQFKKGTLFLAQKSGVPLIPITFAAEKCWRFNSWDRFVLPKPFSRCVFIYHDPILIPDELKGDELDLWCKKLQSIMNDQVNEAEEYFGRADDEA
ncbi:hypothetical protein CEE37_02105 [candidate division LCP-89 bacterium B3_LCP]|uniref:DUF374 domain-containing protein n=1 Tax=candidate division LCP-89 bacterium B3_LCP TaxID=2012998 RepID=A0A532V5N6_UNCL8|nr:MAG: hypothetical protein CEE37_02105 [candidate division LCP-89 bacterium B3_LCP]